VENWLNAQLGRLTRQLAIGAAVLAFGVGATWVTMRSRVDSLEEKLLRMDETGTKGLMPLDRKVDSLRWEMKQLPDRVANQVADELELRLRRGVR
jgi:hypothetical protein